MGNSIENKGKSQRPKLALVLGSGSVKCAAALGLWEVFRREDIPIDMVVGCSGGSMFSVIIACDIDPDLVKKVAFKIWDRKLFKTNYKALPKILFPRLLKFNASFGLYQDTALERALESFFGDLTFESARIPLYIVATDLMTGKRVVLSKGKVTDAIRASISLPLLLSPKEINGQLLTDGGVSDPLPIGVAIKEGGDIIVAMGYQSPYYEDLNSPGPLMQQLGSISINNLLTANLSFYNLAHYHEMVLIIPKFEEKIGSSDTDKLSYIVETGKRATEEQIPYIKSLLFGDRP